LLGAVLPPRFAQHPRVHALWTAPILRGMAARETETRRLGRGRAHARAAAAGGGRRGSSVASERCTSASCPHSAMLRAWPPVHAPATLRRSGPAAARAGGVTTGPVPSAPVGWCAEAHGRRAPCAVRRISARGAGAAGGALTRGGAGCVRGADADRRARRGLGERGRAGRLKHACEPMYARGGQAAGLAQGAPGRAPVAVMYLGQGRVG